MPQLHFYVTDEVADRLRERAKMEGISVSRLVAELLKKEYKSGWPDGYFERVVGSWEGAPLVRPDQGVVEERDYFSSEKSMREAV